MTPSVIPSSYILAEDFDATPLELFDRVEAFTAPVIEPDYLDYDTCLYCDDSGYVEAVNQFHLDTYAPCPRCSSEDKPELKPKFNMPAIYLYLYSKMPEEKMTIWEKKHRDSLLEAA